MLILLTIIFVLLFILSYISKRRYGMLGLALLAGSLISVIWSSALTIFLQTQGIQFSPLPLSIVVAGILILLPGLLLLMFGPKYHKKYHRIAGSLLFASLAFVLLLSMVHRDALSLIAENQFLIAIVNLQPLLITTAALLALVDIVIAHWPKRSKKALH